MGVLMFLLCQRQNEEDLPVVSPQEVMELQPLTIEVKVAETVDLELVEDTVVDPSGIVAHIHDLWGDWLLTAPPEHRPVLKTLLEEAKGGRLNCRLRGSHLEVENDLVAALVSFDTGEAKLAECYLKG